MAISISTFLTFIPIRAAMGIMNAVSRGIVMMRMGKCLLMIFHASQFENIQCPVVPVGKNRKGQHESRGCEPDNDIGQNQRLRRGQDHFEIGQCRRESENRRRTLGTVPQGKKKQVYAAFDDVYRQNDFNEISFIQKGDNPEKYQ
jgi:hypothetical protein